MMNERIICNDPVNTILIAGPCAAETEEQIFATARQMAKQFQKSGQTLSYFRAGVWKPRSSPHEFKGSGKKALAWLSKIEPEFGFPVCVEVARPEHLDYCEEAGIKAVWIGSRTTVNPFLVQELADAVQGRGFSVFVKNPVIPDLKLWAGGIERFLKAGVTNLMAIHRGFPDKKENIYRNSPLWDIPIELKVQYPDIPLLCDPSHIAGHKKYIEQISQTALDFGFNGLMIETHYHPAAALSDAKQQITPLELAKLLQLLVFKSSLPFSAENLLRKQRNLIENIDLQISELLQKRMHIVDEIADIKLENNLPLVQPNQWKKIMKTYLSDNLKDDMYEEFIQRFLEILHSSSIQRQQARIDKTKK